MLTRRTLLASSAATVAAPAVLTEARAATPKGVAVMAKQIDDIGIGSSFQSQRSSKART